MNKVSITKVIFIKQLLHSDVIAGKYLSCNMEDFSDFNNTL